MREHKFRAWDKIHKEIIGWEQYKDEMVSNDFEDDDLIIMQWTGAEDILGKDIYEGDLVQVGEGNWKCEIYFSYEYQAFMLKDQHPKYQTSLNFLSQFDKYKVIGNIYEGSGKW